MSAHTLCFKSLGDVDQAHRRRRPYLSVVYTLDPHHAPVWDMFATSRVVDFHIGMLRAPKSTVSRSCHVVEWLD